MNRKKDKSMNMKKQTGKQTLFALVGAMIVTLFASNAEAQFNKAVVLLRGTVKAEQTGKAQSVRVSVREIGNKALEVTGSVANSESGSYLVVLKPGRKYWVHLEGENIVTKDEMVEAPEVAKTTDLNKNFTVTLVSSVKNSFGENK
jgi:hypothetical protein